MVMSNDQFEEQYRNRLDPEQNWAPNSDLSLDLSQLSLDQLNEIYHRICVKKESHPHDFYNFWIQLNGPLSEEQLITLQKMLQLSSDGPLRLDFRRGSVNDIYTLFQNLIPNQVSHLTISGTDCSTPRFTDLMHLLIEQQTQLEQLQLYINHSTETTLLLKDFIPHQRNLRYLLLGSRVDWQAKEPKNEISDATIAELISVLSTTSLNILSIDGLNIDESSFELLTNANVAQLVLLNAGLNKMEHGRLLSLMENFLQKPKLKTVVLPIQQIEKSERFKEFQELSHRAFLAGKDTLIYPEAHSIFYDKLSFEFCNRFNAGMISHVEQYLAQFIQYNRDAKTIIAILDYLTTNQGTELAFTHLMTALSTLIERQAVISYYGVNAILYDIIEKKFFSFEQFREIISSFTKICGFSKHDFFYGYFISHNDTIAKLASTYQAEDIVSLLLEMVDPSQSNDITSNYELRDLLENIRDNHPNQKLRNLVSVIFIPSYHEQKTPFTEALYERILGVDQGINDLSQLKEYYDEFLDDQLNQWIEAFSKLLHENLSIQISDESYFGQLKKSLRNQTEAEMINSTSIISYFLIQYGLANLTKTQEPQYEDSTFLLEPLKMILKYPNPETKVILSQSLTRILLNPTAKSILINAMTPVGNKKLSSHKIVPILCLLDLIDDFDSLSNEDQKNCLEFITNFSNRIGSFYQEGPFQQLLVNGLLSLKKSSLPLTQKLNIIKEILSIGFKPNGKRDKNISTDAMKAEHRDSWFLVEGLFTNPTAEVFGSSDHISIEALKKSYEGLLVSTFIKAIPNGTDINANGFHEKFKQFFAKNLSEKPQLSSLLTYLGKISSLGDNEKTKLFIHFIESTLSEGAVDFYRFRYENPENSHLSHIFSRYPEIQSSWTASSNGIFQKPLNDVMQRQADISVGDPQMSYLNAAEFIRRKVFEEQHLGLDNLEKFQHLTQFFESQDLKEKTELRESAKKTFLESKHILERNQWTQEEAKQRNLASKYRFEYHLMSFLLAYEKMDEADPSWVIPCLDELLEDLDCDTSMCQCEFIHDISMLIEHFEEQKATAERLQEAAENPEAITKSKQKSYGNYTIDLTDDYWEVFHCGDVTGSCQRISGDPDLNQCLLAYLMDGKNRMIIVRDENQNLVSRAFLRLMLTDQGPVLFKEENYSSVQDPALDMAMNLFAKDIAKQLGLSLYSKNYFLPEVEGVERAKVFCLDGVAPVEYVDALRSEVEGEFTIPNARCLHYDPRFLSEVVPPQGYLPAFEGAVPLEAADVGVVLPENELNSEGVRLQQP